MPLVRCRVGHSLDCQRRLWDTSPWKALRRDILWDLGFRCRPAHRAVSPGSGPHPTPSDTDRPVLPGQQVFWPRRPPEGGPLIQPWQWGKVSWGGQHGLVCALFLQPRWQLAHSLCLPTHQQLPHSQSQPSGLSRTPQVRAGWWLWPLAPELKQGSESCCSQASLSPTHALLYGLIFPVVKVQLQARLTTQPELAPRPQNTARCPSVRSPSWSHCVGTCPPQLDGELFDTGDPFS